MLFRSDFVVHGLLNLYIYHPGIMPNLPADGPLGLILAEYLFLPSLASSLAAVPKRHRLTAALLMTVLVLIVEDLFTAAGALENRGWLLTYSALLFPLYFGGLTWWADWFPRKGYSGLRRLIVVAAAAGYMIACWGAVGGLVLGLWSIRTGLLPHSFPDKVLGLLLHNLPAVVLFIPAVYGRWTVRPALYPVAFTAFTLLFLLLARGGLWENAAAWHPALEGLAVTLLLYGVSRLDHWMAAQLQPSHL